MFVLIIYGNLQKNGIVPKCNSILNLNVTRIIKLIIAAPLASLRYAEYFFAALKNILIYLFIFYLLMAQTPPGLYKTIYINNIIYISLVLSFIAHQYHGT